MKRHAAVFAAAMLSTSALAGCSQEVAEPEPAQFTKIEESTAEAAAEESTPEMVTETVTEGASKSEKPSTTPKADTPVNPADYERAGMSVFTYDLGSYSGTCAISPHGATCQGKTPADAPTVTAVPLPPRQADAIYTGDDGMHFTVFEGVGPSQGRVDAGQSISVAESSCRYSTRDTLTCTSHGNSFTIAADGTITTSGQLDDPPVWTLPDYY